MTHSPSLAQSLRRMSPWLLAVAALVVPLFVSNPAHLNFAILVLMAAEIGVAWNLLGGYAGMDVREHELARLGVGLEDAEVGDHLARAFASKAELLARL